MNAFWFSNLVGKLPRGVKAEATRGPGKGLVSEGLQQNPWVEAGRANGRARGRVPRAAVLAAPQ